MAMPRLQRLRASGFTLIELLVAISLMALMAALSWRGLDGMTRAQTQMRQHSDDVLTLQAGLAQWGADLDALTSQQKTPSLDWDGRTMRILRRGTGAPDAGLRVVAWSRRAIDGAGHWLRWQSPPVTTRGQLQQAWQQAALWGQNPTEEARAREVRVAALDQWRIFYFRKDAWVSAFSSPGATSTASTATDIPDGVRMELTLSGGQAISGRVTRDWVRPTLGGGK